MILKMYQLPALLVGLLLVTGCGGKKDQNHQEDFKPVKYGTVQLSGGVQERTFNGISKSSSETNLSFRANGLILKLNVKVGQKVRKGQLLGQLDQKDVLISLEKAKTDLRNTEVQLETAKSNLERVKQLYQTNNASLSDYEQAKSGFSNAHSNYKASQRAVDLQRSQIEYTQMKAPMDGVISAVNGSVNEFAQAGSPIIVMSTGKADAEVDVGMPEGYISRTKHGDEVAITFLSVDDKEIKGIVTEVGYSTVGASTFPVTVTILEPSEDIRPGMAAKVTFRFGDEEAKPSQLVVPVKAVGDDPQGNFVFVLEKENAHYVAQKKHIEVGALVSEGFIVLSGLKEGDLVAIAGLRSLFDGRKVTLLQ